MSPEKTRKKLKTKKNPTPTQVGPQTTQQTAQQSSQAQPQPQATSYSSAQQPQAHAQTPAQPQVQPQTPAQLQAPPPGYTMRPASPGNKTVPPPQPPASPASLSIPAQQQTAVSPTAVSPTATSPTNTEQPPYYSEPPTLQPGAQPPTLQPQAQAQEQAKTQTQTQPSITQTKSKTEKTAKRKKDKLKSKKSKSPKYKPPSKAKGEKKYRYAVRILKGSILPMLFAIMSFISLYSSVNEFEGYFKFETWHILIGFLIGFVSTTAITLVNCRTAIHNPTGIKMNVALGFIGIILFIVIVLYIGFMDSLALAWQFAMGFFLSAFFPWLFVLLYELASKNKFYVIESDEAPLDTRRLVAIPS